MSQGFADRMERMILNDGWVVVEKVPRQVGTTGAVFSVGYLVEAQETGQRAFLKALDIRSLLDTTRDVVANLSEVTSLFAFEREICAKCKRMDRVVSIIGSDQVQLDASDPYSVVPYLIFEAADGGDVRTFISRTDLPVSWALRSLHHVATGIRQLHSADIVHQDLKPSNVLVFNVHGDEQVSKVADLGRATERSRTGPHDEMAMAGSWLYAPPELLYGQLAPEFNERRLACDVYLLGSLVAFYLTGVSMNALLMRHLAMEFHPRQFGGMWTGNYPEVLPHLQKAFGSALTEFESACPEGLRDELTPLLRSLCDPNPRSRGLRSTSPVTRENRYSLEYYVSRFDNLARRSEAAVRLRAV